MDYHAVISILKEQTKNPSSRSTYTVGDVKIVVKKETHRTRGEDNTIRRLYVCDKDTEAPGVGWVVCDSVAGCMVCGELFGMFLWPHHCRCCGNLVCNTCSPEEVEVVELNQLGPVRVCVLCFWGQDPVHANFLKEASEPAPPQPTAATTPSKLPTTQEIPAGLVPTAFFVVEFEASTSKMGFVNICVHEAMLSLPEEVDFAVCDEVNTAQEGGHAVDVYHVLLRPDLIEADFSEDNIDQFEEVATVIVNGLASKFKLQTENMRVLPDRTYVGKVGTTVRIPSKVAPVALRSRSTEDPVNDGGFSKAAARRQTAFISHAQISEEDDDGMSQQNMAAERLRMKEVEEENRRKREEEEEARRLALELAAAEQAEMLRIAAEKAAALKAEEEQFAALRLAVAKAEAARIAAEKAEADQLAAEKAAAEKAEADRIEAERLLALRLSAEAAQAAILAAEKAAAENADKEEIERLAALRLAAAAAEAERLAGEQAAKKRAEEEKVAAEKAAAEKAEANRLAAKKAEEDRIAAEKAEVERQRVAAEKAEAVRLEAERAAALAAVALAERLARERAESDRLEAERVAAEKAEKQRVKAERLAAKKAEEERIAAGKAEAERLAAEQAEAARVAAEKAEAERIAAENVEAERIAVEKAEGERTAAKQAKSAAEKAEAERIAAEKAETDRIEAVRIASEIATAAALAEQLVAEKAAAEKAESDRLAAEKAAADSEKARLVAAAAAAEKAAAEEADRQRVAAEAAAAAAAPALSVTVERSFPAVTAEATPWVVLKTKKGDNKKVFVNVLHHASIPHSEDESAWEDSAFQAYIKQSFVLFTLNKSKYAMFISESRETADKEGGSSLVTDVTIHPSVFLIGSKDEELCDKLFVKMLKAVSRKLNTELDADYKMPKILRNYKGTAVAPLQIPAFSAMSGLAAPAESSPRSLSVEEPVKGGQQASVDRPAGPSRQISTNTLAKNMDQGPRSDYPINPEWNNRWKAYLPAGFNVVFTASTVKTNKFGMKQVRQLILTDVPSLLYVDVHKNVLKGNISWTKTNPPQAAKTTATQFTVTTTGRVYKFDDQDGSNVETWVERINSVAKLTQRKSFVVTAASSGLDDF